MLSRPFSAALNAVVNPDNVKASVRLYICGSDGCMLRECSMKLSDVAIVAFTFCSRVLFVLNMAEKQSLVGITAGTRNGRG